jgi:ADP-ribose pyrophosphatase
LDKKEIFKGRVVTFNLEEFLLPNGHVAKLEVARHLDAAAIVPLTDDSERVLLIRQFRPVLNAWLWEIPAGLLEKGEDPKTCAARELEEETGWIAEKVEPVVAIPTSCGFTDEYIHIFKGVGLKPGRQAREPGEVIEERFFTRDEVRRMIAQREIVDSKTLAGLLLTLFF